MKKIVAIGGGSFRTKSTLMIDKEIVRLSGKKHPTALFIPTASGDAEAYWEQFDKYFRRLGCKTEVLYLIKGKPGQKEIAKKILSADIIYVGGGNTLMMMRFWHSLGVDKLLKQAYAKGAVMSGLSAGSICWFEWGHSDSMSFYQPKKWKYIRVRGLGLIKGIHCPHYDSHTNGVWRRKQFQKMVKERGGLGIAIDEDCAIEFIDNKFRVISSKRGKSAYVIRKINGKIVETKISETKSLLPLSELNNL